MKKLLLNDCAQTVTSTTLTLDDVVEILNLIDELQGIPIFLTADKDGLDVLHIGNTLYSIQTE